MFISCEHVFVHGSSQFFFNPLPSYQNFQKIHHLLRRYLQNNTYIFKIYLRYIWQTGTFSYFFPHSDRLRATETSCTISHLAGRGLWKNVQSHVLKKRGAKPLPVFRCDSISRHTWYTGHIVTPSDTELKSSSRSGLWAFQTIQRCQERQYISNGHHSHYDHHS